MAIPSPVSSSFCAPHETELVVKGKSYFSREYTVKDGQGVLLFNMIAKGGFFSHTKRRIHNAASGEEVLSIMEEVNCCARSSWIAFRGETQSESELLFTMRRQSSFSSACEVFLPENNDSSRPDFSVKKRAMWSSSFSILYNGRPIAEAKRTGWASSGYVVTVYPGVDRAFITALTIIWMILRQRDQNSAAASSGGAS